MLWRHRIIFHVGSLVIKMLSKKNTFYINIILYILKFLWIFLKCIHTFIHAFSALQRNLYDLILVSNQTKICSSKMHSNVVNACVDWLWQLGLKKLRQKYIEQHCLQSCNTIKRQEALGTNNDREPNKMARKIKS